MGKTQYQKCIEIMEDLKALDIKEINFDNLMIEIKKHIGNDKYRVLIPCFKLMIETKLIEEKDGFFKIL